jgi:hypothetical protein
LREVWSLLDRCCVDIREPNGRLAGYGTDSLVSPQLVLTNHHVLPDAESAASSTIEFIFQEGLASRVRLWSLGRRPAGATEGRLAVGPSSGAKVQQNVSFPMMSSVFAAHPR